MIEGVRIKKLKQFVDERGRVMHMIRADDPLFAKFGEIYFSEVLPGVVKAWKKHRIMSQLFAVPIGMIRLVIYDDRDHSRSKGAIEEYEIGRENYRLAKIPPMLWYGFQCLGNRPALVVNCADMPHDPDEATNCKSFKFHVDYVWDTENR